MLDGSAIDTKLLLSTRTGFWFNERPDLRFWICFLALNALLFTPFYLLTRESSTFWPTVQTNTQSIGILLRDLTLWRENFDLFRFNLELALLVALWIYVQRTRGRVLFWLLNVGYLFALLYYSYEAILIYLYQVEPVLYNQLHLFGEGLPFLMRHLHLPIWTYAAALLLTISIVAGIIFLVRNMVAGAADRRLSRATRLIFGSLVALLSIAAIFYQSSLAQPQMVVSSLTYKVARNASESLRIYREVLGFDDGRILAAYDYDDHILEQRPNIYLVFVESYGSVLYKRPDYKIAYEALLDELETGLASAGWHASSALSEAPTWGGGSWLSYTSALFGLNIDNHPQFLSLLNRYQYADFPDFGSYLKTQGYRYVRLSSLSTEMRDDVWLQYKNFYGADQWLRYRDLEYVGPEYGWGPAPPDQYAFNFADRTIRDQSDEPLLLFFITQNSHYPWTPLPELVEDWQTLNAPGTEPEAPNPEFIDHEVRRQNYFNAVEYQLRFLTDFVMKQGDEDAILILVGDHQPPRVSRRNDGFDTPLHVIGRDQQFVESFEEFGFEPGLSVSGAQPTMKHAGLYSMLVRLLVDRYGADKESPSKSLPEYYPDGITISPRLPVD